MRTMNVNGKMMRGLMSAAVVAGVSMMGVSAFATPKPVDNGGNGEGTLLIYPSATDAQTGKNPTDSLASGQTYYIVLVNPGGNTAETNLKNVPATLDFSFYNPPVDFQGNPAKSNGVTATFAVDNAQEVGTTSPYTYAVTIPQAPAGNYSIATFGANPQPMSDGTPGEDEFFFSTDPMIDGTAGIPLAPLPDNKMPEVPFAAILPAALAVVGGAIWAKKRRAL